MSLENLDAGASPAPVADSAPPVANDTPSTPPADTQKTEAPNEAALDDDLRRVFRNASRERDESGRFVPKDGKPAQAPVEAVEGAPEAPAPEVKPEPAKPAVEPPRAWKDEVKAKWQSLDPELQTYVASREQELHEVKSQFGRLQSQFEPIGQVLGQHQNYLQQVARTAGVDVPTFLNQMLAASHALDTNPKETIKQLAEMYRVDLGELYDPLAPTPDPAVTALKQEVEQLKGLLNRQQSERAATLQQQQAAREQEMLSAVDEFFSATPDAKGLEAEIEVQISALRKADPNKDAKTLLRDAFERAVWANPERRAARLKAEQEAAERSRIEAAQKAAKAAQSAARVNVNGSPRAAANADDIDGELRAIWRKNANR